MFLEDCAANAMAKRVVITGCTRGIGRALFEHFAMEHEVAGCGRSAVDLEALKLKQPKAKLKRLDLSSSSELQRWCEELKTDWGQIDLLVANAGMMPPPAKTLGDPSPRLADGLGSQCPKYLSSFAPLCATAEGRIHCCPHLFTLRTECQQWDGLLQCNQVGN